MRRKKKGKRPSHRTYIGPDSDEIDKGKDKIPVEVRYSNIDNKVTFSGPLATHMKLVTKQSDIGCNISLTNAKDAKPGRSLIFVHPQPDPRPSVNLTPSANLATQDNFVEEIVAFVCQAPDYFESDGVSVPEFHLAEKLGYTGFNAVYQNFVPEVKTSKRVTLNKKNKKKLAEGLNRTQSTHERC